MKFCKDCVYFRRVEFKSSVQASEVTYHTCAHPETADVVTGKMPIGLYCSDVRRDTNLCGREGRWFKLYVPPTNANSHLCAILAHIAREDAP